MTLTERSPRTKYEQALEALLAEARAALPAEYCGPANSLAGRIDDVLHPAQGEPIAGSLAAPTDLVFENYGDGMAWFRR